MGALEEFARSRIQGWIQDLLEEEVGELLGRRKSERRAAVDAPEGYRNGQGRPRRLSMIVVESPFSAVRLRTDAARRYKKVANAEALIWKILTIAEKKFRRLNAPELLEEVYNGQRFEDGIEVKEKIRPRRLRSFCGALDSDRSYVGKGERR